MDSNIPLDDDEIERRLLAQAVEEALNDPRPAIPHDIVRLQLLETIERLQRKPAKLVGE